MTQLSSGMDGSAESEPEVQWRRLDRRLWVGRAGQRNLGTIELGSRYVYVDVDGTAHEGRSTLHEAQDQATGPIEVVRSSMTPNREQARFPPAILLVLLGLVMVGAVWAVGSTLFLQ